MLEVKEKTFTEGVEDAKKKERNDENRQQFNPFIKL